MKPAGWDEYARDLAELRARIDHLERQCFVSVAAARAAGVPWQLIGDALGTSRQAAWEKYGKKTHS